MRYLCRENMTQDSYETILINAMWKKKILLVDSLARNCKFQIQIWSPLQTKRSLAWFVFGTSKMEFEVHLIHSKFEFLCTLTAHHKCVV